ncbi:hypothetical protein DH2020_029632 [Rehmannia glutinosa]|uniref:Dirigent protein n=1 Tax=Rehmannia glutinosa TaxID=99300 RepID=A0ABR0VNU5_REHGL
MGKQFILLMLFSIATMAIGKAIPKETYLQNISLAKEKVTQFQLYVQDILSGPNVTIIQVAWGNYTLTSPTSFGLVVVFDDPVRTRSNPDSEIVGRAQGLVTFASLEGISLHMTHDIVFTSGEYNGSTLNLVGRNPLLRDYHEFSVVGGSGTFRLARGFVVARTVSNSTYNTIFEYNVTVIHYSFVNQLKIGASK